MIYSFTSGPLLDCFFESKAHWSVSTLRPEVRARRHTRPVPPSCSTFLARCNLIRFLRDGSLHIQPPLPASGLRSLTLAPVVGNLVPAQDWPNPSLTAVDVPGSFQTSVIPGVLLGPVLTRGFFWSSML